MQIIRPHLDLFNQKLGGGGEDLQSVLQQTFQVIVMHIQVGEQILHGIDRRNTRKGNSAELNNKYRGGEDRKK